MTRWVGQPVKGVDAVPRLTGAASYLDDISLDGMVYAGMVRSTYAHARIRRIDGERAAATGKLIALRTADDLRRDVRPLVARATGLRDVACLALASGKARYAGEPLAVVVAATPAEAQDVKDLIDVEYEPLAPVTDVEAAVTNDVVLHDELGTNVLYERRMGSGDVAAAFSAAALVLEETFRFPRSTGVPLETRGVVATRVGDGVTVWSSTQHPHLLRDVLASCLGLAPESVRVIAPDVGGGFGIKDVVYPEEIVVPYLALTLGRPVKWVATRLEAMSTDIHAHEQVIAVRAAADAAGVILGMEVDILADGGAYPTYPMGGVALEAALSLSSLPRSYRVDVYRGHVLGLATNKSPVGPFRGVGMPIAFFAMERVLDMVAQRLGVDPADVRRRNLIPAGEVPYVTATGYVYDNRSHLQAFEQSLELCDYEGLRRRQKQLRAEGRYLGIGFSSVTELSGAGGALWRQVLGMVSAPCMDAARVRLTAGGVQVYVSHPNIGQGNFTAFSQVVADALELDLHQVEVFQTDTATAPYGAGTWGSRGSTCVVAALMKACGELKGKLGGRTAAALLRQASMGGGALDIEATATVDDASSLTAAAHVALVEVEPETGGVRLVKYWLVEDAGTIINPEGARGQILGGLCQGFGLALSETLVYDDVGSLVTGDLLDYALPRADLMPSEIEIGHLHTPSTKNSVGSRGMAESGTMGAPAAVANAVADALAPFGSVITELPLTSERLVSLVRRGTATPTLA